MCVNIGKREMWTCINNSFTLYSEVNYGKKENCGKGWNKICRLASNLLLHYLGKFEYSAVQL